MNKRTSIGLNCTPIENVPQRNIIDIPNGTIVSIEIKNHVFLREIRVLVNNASSFDDIKAAIFMAHNYIIDRPHLLTIAQKRSLEMNAHDRRSLNKDVERNVQQNSALSLYDFLTYGYSNGYL